MNKIAHIIGAGISGLSAGVRLANAGYTVHVHEATQQLGGRMMLESRVGQGTTFRIIMPRVAKGGSETAENQGDGITQWPNRTMSST